MSLRPKVVAAVVRKDLHALWPMAAVATLLVLADIVVAEFGLGSLGGSLPLRTLLPFVTQLTYGLLVVAVIQQDTAVSTTHDWLTKPISRLDMADDVLATPLPIADGPSWGVPVGDGLGIRVDEAKVRKYHEHYRAHGQFLPYQPSDIGK